MTASVGPNEQNTSEEHLKYKMIKALGSPGINLTENKTVSDEQCESKETGRTCCRYQIYLE